MDIMIEVIAASLAYALLSVLIQKKFGNMKEVYRHQDLIKQKTNELNALSKSGAPAEHLKKKQDEIMPLVAQAMRHQMKPLIILLPLSIFVFYYLLPNAFPSTVMVSILSNKFSSGTFFIICTIIFGLLFAFVLRKHTMDKIAQEKQ